MLTKNSLESYLIYSFLGMGLVYWSAGFEIALVAGLSVIMGYVGKIYIFLREENGTNT